MLCLGTLAFTYRDLWYLFIFLVLSSIWLYNLDKWRLLCASSKGSFVSQKMDVTAQWLAAFPCGILAACMVFRVFGIAKSAVLEDVLATIDGIYNIRGNVETLSWLLNRDVVVICMIIAVGLHVIVHFWILHRFVPGWSQVQIDGHNEEVHYATTAEQYPCNWFNSNPVHCLRSRYIHKHEVPCVKFENGRNYLLLKNEKLGLHYQREAPPEIEKGVTYEDVVRYGKELKDTAAERTKAAVRSVGELVSRPIKAEEEEGEQKQAEEAPGKSSSD